MVTFFILKSILSFIKDKKKNNDNININEKTGELTIEPTAKPGIFIIYAKNILYPDIKKSLLIDIER